MEGIRNGGGDRVSSQQLSKCFCRDLEIAPRRALRDKAKRIPVSKLQRYSGFPKVVFTMCDGPGPRRPQFSQDQTKDRDKLIYDIDLSIP